ncbi:thioredoxin [Noviherbaspirillum cavernae]|uniref:Thioredoxin n=1 Tax=Noviherbaspirillum cavernae TaxID=2320862 RepID=A0A418WZQ8_9BURK|nr:thioredoxin fold domain-containing protein [Noviherbaspirillum cavernae]RJG05696.1 thioredoxin [Noviherbaspirillum cavernae]
MIRRCFIALLACGISGAYTYAQGGAPAIPAPVDLQRDGAQSRREGKPVVILFSLPGCAFCQVVRQNYLLPLLRDSTQKERPIIREIDITSTKSLVGFHGEQASHQSIAKELHIRFAPTVVFLDASGRLLTQPIIGGDTAGLYGGYLENAFDESAKKLGFAQ